MNKTEFISYVLDFYGKGQMYSNFFKKPVTKARVTKALKKHLSNIETLTGSTADFCGDSFDREMVRDIMLAAEGQTTEHKIT